MEPSFWLRKLACGCRGTLLAEVVIAVMVFTLVGTAVLAGVSTIQLSGARIKGHSIAENLARNQMEYLFSLPYQEPPSTYPSIATPPGYSVDAATFEYVIDDLNIARVVVSVSRGGQQIQTLETLRSRK